jgi:hypothetical protein
VNPTTRRHPRTLQDAFGPYTNHVIFEGAMKPPRKKLPTLIRCVAPWYVRAWRWIRGAR